MNSNMWNHPATQENLRILRERGHSVVEPDDGALAFDPRSRSALRHRHPRVRGHAVLNRILVIRGGAIGDFVLTLPATKLLRDRFAGARLEILGYPQIIALAEKLPDVDPATVRFTSAGAYSNVGSAARAHTSSATPRA